MTALEQWFVSKRKKGMTMDYVGWTCEHCHTSNAHQRSKTETPTCRGCQRVFAWDDIEHRGDDLDGYLNLLDRRFKERFGIGPLDERGLDEAIVDELLNAMQWGFMNGDTVDKTLNTLAPTLAKGLWAVLGDVPTSLGGEWLDEPFLHFPKGTAVDDVWHWFEATFNVSVATDLFGFKTPA